MRHHFKINFGIVHDVDWPFNARGKNGMWSTNASIHAAISTCREDSIIVRHRYSVPDFERYMGGEELGKDKPLETYLKIKSDPDLKRRVQGLILDLYSGDDHGPHSKFEHDAEKYLANCLSELHAWADNSGNLADSRLKLPEKITKDVK